MKKKNKKTDPEDFTKKCKKCEYLSNCAGWADETICQDFMRQYFSQHPEGRITESDS